MRAWTFADVNRSFTCDFAPVRAGTKLLRDEEVVGHIPPP
jgi:hypothetical protein